MQCELLFKADVLAEEEKVLVWILKGMNCTYGQTEGEVISSWEVASSPCFMLWIWINMECFCCSLHKCVSISPSNEAFCVFVWSQGCTQPSCHGDRAVTRPRFWLLAFHPPVTLVGVQTVLGREGWLYYCLIRLEHVKFYLLNCYMYSLLLKSFILGFLPVLFLCIAFVTCMGIWKKKTRSNNWIFFVSVHIPWIWNEFEPQSSKFSIIFPMRG